MSIGLIVIIVLLSWALGPAILRWAGGFLALATLLLWAFPLGTHTPPMALLVTGIGGALLWCAGMSWQDTRDTGRAPLMLDLLAAPLQALRHQRRRGWMRAAAAGPSEQPHSAHYAGYSDRPLQGEPRHAREGGSSSRRRTSPGEESSSPRDAWPRWPSDTACEGDESTPEPAVIDGVAHDLDATPEEDEASRRRSLREDVDRTLEQARDHLEPIVYGLFVNTGGGWLDRLNAARRKRRADLPAIDGDADVFHDRRVLFAVIAYDWSLIGHAFMRDPSRAGRALCAIANRYAHEGPHDSDPAAARQAFGEICAALRPESVARVSWLFQPSR